ncbi:hypothetical protein FisN_8Hh405 [Fistulifera solaris]|uniref:Protein kinase domain-containing protein n=1 Tax=Fistulifera solaris TaxID=1519565 RepID=A0A1Z5JNE6_FISSO|nr:hypothetical protein FisN_8Hh405 [Fistulifera solaris]|eukprot:GAX15298.1 hypothetical protein FisN_8Hh405 [Fistulifera solaris]
MGIRTTHKAPTPQGPARKNSTETYEGSSASSGNGMLPESDFCLQTPHAKGLVRAAKHISHSPTFSISGLKSIPSFSRDDLEVGSVLGVGGYGFVNKVKTDKIKNTKKSKSRTNPNSQSDKLVVKTLFPHTAPNQLLSGCHQLEKEKRVLSQLNHPNIISLRGYSEKGLDSIAETKRIDSCFLLLDFLPETLTDRIEKWGRIIRTSPKKKTQRRWSLLSRKRFPFDRDMFIEQIQVAIDIASALRYLHEKRIILRDLKPDNVGFDESNCTKLFDFGLIAQLPKFCNLDKTHNIPGNIGTPRYMAPEVLREQPYNVKADVFSFSQVLWEILTQERAPGANSSRPMIPKEWPGTLRRILERGWSEDLNERPCMTEYKYALEDLLRQAKEASN